MRKKYGLENGICVCLEPLNNILFEKTNCKAPIKTAYLTVSGQGIQEDNVSLSHSADKLTSGEIGILLGHAESFLSPKGNV